MIANDDDQDAKMGILEWALCGLLVATVLVTFAQVVFRDGFNYSLPWSTELAKLIFLWLGALGMAYAFKTKSHFLLRFLVDKFSPRTQILLSTFFAAVMAVFLVTLTWQGVLYAQIVVDQEAHGTGFSLAVSYSAVVVGGVLMLYYMLRNWWHEVCDYRRDNNTDGSQN